MLNVPSPVELYWPTSYLSESPSASVASTVPTYCEFSLTLKVSEDVITGACPESGGLSPV